MLQPVQHAAVRRPERRCKLATVRHCHSAGKHVTTVPVRIEDRILRRRDLIALPAASAFAQSAPPRPRVACILNVYSPNSHADVFMSRLLDGYRLNGKWHSPRVQTVKFYVDQFPFNDMAREQAAEYGIEICKTVTDAIADVNGI